MSHERLEMKFTRHGLPTAVLDIREASAYLGVAEITLRRMVQRGEVPHTRIGRAIRFRVADLDAYLEANTSRKWEAEDGRGRPLKAE